MMSDEQRKTTSDHAERALYFLMVLVLMASSS
jgi:hypothetical protein